jgi:hypothetical protein
MPSPTPIFDQLELRLENKRVALQQYHIKIEIRKPVEKAKGIFCGLIEFESRSEITSFTLWEREIIQLEIMVLDLSSKKSRVLRDGLVRSCDDVLKAFDELCDSLIKG